MSIVICPNCKMKVVPHADGSCPSCQFMLGMEDEGVVLQAPVAETSPEMQPAREQAGLGDLVALGAALLGVVLVGVVYSLLSKKRHT